MDFMEALNNRVGETTGISDGDGKIERPHSPDGYCISGSLNGQLRVLRANELSGFVAHDLSGSKLSSRGGTKREADKIATGDSEDEIHGGI
jgi:hypothetical protein